jgi:gliding motility-associated-like protein
VVDPLPSNPVLTSIPAFICEETSATITASSNPASSNITWWDGNNINSNVLDTGNTFTTPILNSTTTFYMLSVSDEGCTNIGGFIPVNVNVRPRPIVSLTSDAVLGFAYQGQLITFTAEPFGYQNYVFYINNNQVQNSSSNTYQNNTLNNGDWVSVSVTENGCESKDKAELKMEIKPLSNAFTPNNDGTNDLFLKGLELQILNRWGQELYKGIEGWDGAFQGKIVSPGTYFYIVTFKDLNGNETKLNGPVTLIGD